MQSLRFAIVAAFIAAFGVHNALALEVDNSSQSTPAAANLADPDDNVPVAHLDDSGNAQSSPGFNFQLQGDNSAGFGNNNSGPSAFERAQQNQMGQ